MNSLLKHGYISKLLILKTDAQYSKAAEARLQNYNAKQNSFHINSALLFSKTFYDSKIYYTVTFTYLIQILRAQFVQPRKRAGVQIPKTPPLDAHQP